MNDERRVFTVTEITRRIKSLLEADVGHIWLEGEVSNTRRPASGHYYFTLKDETTQISAVLFRGSQRGLATAPKDGLRVRVFGQVTVYERGGNYQVIVRQLEESGKGVLQEQFEKLKEALRKEGLFDAERKRPIPVFPQHIGVVTSPTGAAIRDILNVLQRRFPNLHLLLAPVKVQGEKAAAEIAAAIDLLNQRGGLDVLIVGRGGGSLEDLWCFNEESVARAIARSRIPVISAVGHEIDFTISDFTADLRAPTPSAAAELVVGRKEVFEEQLASARRRLADLLQAAVLRARNRVQAAAGSHVFQEPRLAVERYRQALDRLQVAAIHGIRGRLRDAQQAADDLGLRLAHRVQLWDQGCADRLQGLGRQLRALDPHAVLERGYSVTRAADGRVLRTTRGLEPGSAVTTRLGRGTFESEVTAVDDDGKDAP